VENLINTLFTTALLRVNPEPSTNTTSFGAGRHSSGDLKICLLVPDACMIHAEDGEIFRLNLVDVRLICDGQCTSFQVRQTLCMVDHPKRTNSESEMCTTVNESVIHSLSLNRVISAEQRGKADLPLTVKL
jgi:hypothetical protein